MIDKVLPNTDNFFKYLLTIGILLIFFAILYPLQKQQEIDLQINEYSKNVAVYNYKVDLLEKETTALEKLLNNTQHEITNLAFIQKAKNSNPDSIRNRMLVLKAEFDVKKEVAIKKGEELKMIQISQKYENEKINKMQDYLSSYWFFKVLFIIVGVLLSLFGIRFWAASAYLDEHIKAKGLDPTYKHSYVRCLNWIKNQTIRFRNPKRT